MAKKEKAVQMENKEMTDQEAKALYTASYKPVPRKMSDKEKRESFRIFWAQNRKKYGKSKDLEGIIWLHLKAAKMNDPEKFEAGIAHFGFKKTK